MKSLFDRFFKNKSEKQDYVKDLATEAAVEAIIPKVKKHIDCECEECVKRIKQNAK